jgi:adenylate kinase family enzyme
MAEGVLFDLSGKVLEVAGPFALQEIKLASGVKAELENLKSTVSRIQAVLLDAEKKAYDSSAVKDWLERLKDLFLDADDLLDDFNTEAMQREVMTGNKMKKEVHIFFSSSNQLAYSLKMGHRIKAIRERLNVIENDRMSFQFIQSPSEPQVKNKARETYSFVPEADVVGREDDKKEVIKLLLDTNNTIVENVSIISIVGIGGLGKTTLAQLIYNDENVQKIFEPKLWICISKIFDVQRIVQEILEQLTKKKHEASLEILQNHLREKLNGKKYLLVLDDVWNEDQEKWLLLRNLLKEGARGSRIIVTTRSVRVVSIIKATSCHVLKGLPQEKAWNLFVKMAFEQGQLPKNQTVISLGNEIVEKCCGVPLAIRTIGGLLRSKDSENEWQSLKNYELSKITQEEESDISSILKTLKLSYDHLPSHLKQCFDYCGLFPKDYKIDVKTLINLWAAQGFIVLSNPKQRVEDVGERYFMELLWRLFFQDVENDGLGNIESCKMHYLMHDLATLVGGKESTMLNPSGKNIGEKVRHVSFYLVDSLSQFPIPMLKGKKIRTILSSSVGGSLGSLTCDTLVSNLNYLRTLDLSNLKLRVVPHSIGELKHLRYLDLSKNEDIKILPNSITKLLNLQTLTLSDCESLRELPKDIKKLVNLRHLYITNCYGLTHMPLGLGHLTSLEILTWFVVSQEGFNARPYCGLGKTKKATSSGLSELKELSNLGGSLEIRRLGHGKDDMVECKATNMKEKQHLQRLILLWDPEWEGETECYDEESLEGLQPHPNLKALELLEYKGVRIPNWVSSLTNLVSLGFVHNWRLQHLSPLNKLPFLKSLSLKFMEELEYISEEEDSVSNVFGGSSSSSSKTIEFFPSLSSLYIGYCSNLKGWWRKDYDNEPDHLLLPSFPCLSKLDIKFCPKLTLMPLFPYLKEKLVDG